jgi:hypothetical protein
MFLGTIVLRFDQIDKQSCPSQNPEFLYEGELNA